MSATATSQSHRAQVTRRMQTGLALNDFSAALGAVIQGFAFRWLTDPEPIRDDIDIGDAHPWSLVAVTIEAIVDRFTEPLPDS